VHFARLATTPPKDEESAQYNHVLACNFAKYLPLSVFFTIDKSGDVCHIIKYDKYDGINAHRRY